MLTFTNTYSELQRAVSYHQLGQLDQAENIYRRILEDDPQHVDALHLLGLVTYQSGRTEIAINLIREAISLSPESSNILCDLGDIFRALGRFEESIQVYQRAMVVGSKSAEIYNAIGLTFKDSGKTEEAIQAYQKAIRIDPDYVEAYNNLGNSFKADRRFKEALQAFQQALKLNPNIAEIHNNLGTVLKITGKIEEAIGAYKTAIEINPDYPHAYSNLGVAYAELRHFEEALQAFQQAIRINPKHSQTYSDIGVSFAGLGQFDKAINSCKRAIELDGHNYEAYNNLGNIYNELGQPEDALQVFQKALAIKPQVAEIHYNFANALKAADRLEVALEEYKCALDINSNIPGAYNGIGLIFHDFGDFNQSIDAYQSALGLKSDYFEVYNNLGNSLKCLGRIEEAIQAYNCALRICPNYDEAEHNLGLTLLTKGIFSRGWILYEKRWRIGSTRRQVEQYAEQSDFCRSYVKTDFPQPLWDGSRLDNKSILVWMEQGVGDHIMFASLLLKLRYHAQRIFVESEHRLLPIFQRSFPGIDFFPVQSPPHSQLLDESIDFQSPVGSLPRYLLPNEDSFVKCVSYLEACRHKTEVLRRKYLQLSNCKFIIGISWKSKNRSFGKLKSTSLDHWESFLSHFQQDCFFISLQYGDVQDEVDAFIGESGIKIYRDEDIDPLENLDDFAAQVSALDLVISTSNTTVHMAGALGKPVWTLLHYVPDWRWMLSRSDSPWYSSMTLFRPEKLGDWYSVFQQVTVNLEKLLLGKKNGNCAENFEL